MSEQLSGDNYTSSPSLFTTTLIRSPLLSEMPLFLVFFLKDFPLDWFVI